MSWVGFIASLAQDIRIGARMLRRSRVLTLTAVLTMAFTIGAVSTVLTFVNTLLFQQLPVERPEEVVEVAATRAQGRVLGFVSYPDYTHFRDQNHTLRGLAAHYSGAPLFVTVNEHVKEINGAVVSANFFPLLGLKPVLGRFFGPEEDRVPQRDYVAVLGHDLWRSWFASSPHVVGETLTINGAPFTIIGVAPPAFKGLGRHSESPVGPARHRRV